MLQQLATTVRAAVEEGGHAAAESGLPAEAIGIAVFALLLTLLVVVMSYANRGLSPEAGQHVDPAELPADEQALLAEYDAKRRA